MTAACAATVDDLAPGRVYIGIGASSLELLDAGAREGGRSADDLEVWFTSFW